MDDMVGACLLCEVVEGVKVTYRGGSACVQILVTSASVSGLTSNIGYAQNSDGTSLKNSALIR